MHRYLFLPCLLIIHFCFTTCQQHPVADLVIRNGTIYTVNERQPTVESVAVKGNKIIFAGTSADVAAFIDEQTQILDLAGSTMTPGFIEGHAHFMGVGTNKVDLDLMMVKSYEEMIEKVAEAVKKVEPGIWITGRGWHQNKWDSLPKPMIKGFQTHQALSEISPDNPVFLRHASGHAGFANAKAMEIAGFANITQEGQSAEFKEGGEIIRDNLGNPTGIFNENAMQLITDYIPERSQEDRMRIATLAMEECLSHGITSFQDAGIDQETVDLYKKLAKEGALKVRLWAMLSGTDTMLIKKYMGSGPEIGLADNFLTIRSIKMYADGALGSRGAWLLEEYTDMPGQFGHETTPMNKIYNMAVQGLQHGFQVCTHAIGDRANREVLNQYEQAFKRFPKEAEDARFRIEHAQHLTEEDIPRFSQLGVIPAMQAIHLSSDRPWAIQRLGQRRIDEGAYVWRKLIDSGATIINGTDAPVEPIDPIASFYASVTRKTSRQEPENGFEPSQKMSRDEALKSYTWNAAYGAFEEDIKGSIEVGKLADFTIFSQDLMKVPENKILNTTIDFTVVNGKIAYSREKY